MLQSHSQQIFFFFLFLLEKLFFKDYQQEMCCVPKGIRKASTTSHGTSPCCSHHTQPTFLFNWSWLCGAFYAQDGIHLCKPVLIKTYACMFICLATQAIHLELCSSLEANEFRSALRQVSVRRGCLTDIYSDSKTNFVGTFNNIQEIQQLLYSSECHFLSLHSSATSLAFPPSSHSTFWGD